MVERLFAFSCNEERRLIAFQKVVRFCRILFSWFRVSSCVDLSGQDGTSTQIRSLNHGCRSIRDLALFLVFLSLFSRVVLALVTDQTVPRLVASTALIAGERLRYVKMRVRQVPLKRPRTRESLLAEATVSAGDRTARVFKFLLDLSSGGVAKFRRRLHVTILR